MRSQILLIDDDTAYCQELQKKAKSALLYLIIAHSLKEGLMLIAHNRRIKVVILDGHGVLEPGQVNGPRANFVYHALHEIDDIEREQDRVIPRCVNSEQPSDFSEELQGLVSLFSKKNDPSLLFRWVRHSLGQLEETKVLGKHSGLAILLPMFFSDTEEDELIDLLVFDEQPVEADIAARLAVLRRLLEKIADVCAIQLLGENPASYASKMGVSVKPVFDSLYSHKIVPAHINRIVHRLYAYCSQYGTHIYRPSVPVYRPGIYAWRQNLNSLLEVIEYCGALLMAKHKT